MKLNNIDSNYRGIVEINLTERGAGGGEAKSQFVQLLILLSVFAPWTSL